MLVRPVGDGPVVVDGETPTSVAQVVVTAADGLHAVRGRESGHWLDLGPGPIGAVHIVRIPHKLEYSKKAKKVL